MSYTKSQKVQTDLRKARRKPTHDYESKALQAQRKVLGPVLKNSGHQIGLAYTKKTRDACVQEKPVFVPPPPGFNRELWDLQFSRWWGWNWVRKQEEETRKNARNPTNVHYITPRTRIEPYKGSKFQQFFRYIKDAYSSAKTKVIEPRVKRSFYTMTPRRKTEISPRTPLISPHFYWKRSGPACQNASISSLFVQAESRHKKYRRNKRSVDAWIVERSDSSSSEEERILTCLSMEETYTTSTEGGGADYLAERLKNIRKDSSEDLKKKRPRKFIFVRNKGTQSSDTVRDSTPKTLCDKSVESERKKNLNAVQKVDMATDVPDFTQRTGLMDKDNFASPLTGNLYKINIPTLPVPETSYPSSNPMFDFIKEIDLSGLKTPPESTTNEHQKLLSAVYDALLSSTERPIANHYYDEDTLNVHKTNKRDYYDEDTFKVNKTNKRDDDIKTKRLFVAPRMMSSDSSNTDHSSIYERPQKIFVKRKSPIPSSSPDVPPQKIHRKSAMEPSPVSSRSIRRVLNNKMPPRSLSSRSSSLDTNETLPVIQEDASTSSIKKQPKSYCGGASGIENYCKLARDSPRVQREDNEEKLRVASKVSVASQNERAESVTNASQTPSIHGRDSWNGTEGNGANGKSYIPIPVKRSVSNSRKRKIN